MIKSVRRRDGFVGEKLINVPPKLLKKAILNEPELFPVYITQIGYFPKATFHHRERRKGCEDNILIYCLHGKGYYKLDGINYEVNSNEFIIIPATEKYMRYWADRDDPWTIYWIHYTGDSIDAFNLALSVRTENGPVLIPYNEKGIEIWMTIYQTLELGFSKANMCNAAFCLYHLLATFLFPSLHSKKDDLTDRGVISKTIDSMRKNISLKVSVDSLASSQNLSASHFSSIFRKATGMPPIDYFNHMKMQKACQLLYSVELKVKDIATELGYEDPYYFSRSFKRHNGLSPERYRLNIRKAG
jgi:AraC-like DNA-binding protein